MSGLPDPPEHQDDKYKSAATDYPIHVELNYVSSVLTQILFILTLSVEKPVVPFSIFVLLLGKVLSSHPPFMPEYDSFLHFTMS